MTRLSIEDNGRMAAVFGPVDEVAAVLEQVSGYVVIANVNSTKECVVGGASPAVEAAAARLRAEGFRVGCEAAGRSSLEAAAVRYGGG